MVRDWPGGKRPSARAFFSFSLRPPSSPKMGIPLHLYPLEYRGCCRFHAGSEGGAKAKVFRVCYSFAMPAQILDGLKIRDEIFSELKEEVARLHRQGIRPGLAAVLVGENPASQLYVKSKIAACEQLGMASWLHTPAAGVSTEYMLQLVADLNADNNVDGILVQLPLPAQID